MTQEQRETKSAEWRKKNLSKNAYSTGGAESKNNVLQLGAVCVGLWVENCAKVLLGGEANS